MTAAMVPTAPPAGMGIDDLLSKPLALVVALAIVSLVPFAFMTVTAFVKIATVLQIVRSAIGAQGIPSSTVIMALSAALTVVAMAPVGDQIASRAAPIVSAKNMDTLTLVRTGIDAVREPLRAFLKANASDAERSRSSKWLGGRDAREPRRSPLEMWARTT